MEFDVGKKITFFLLKYFMLSLIVCIRIISVISLVSVASELSIT